MITFNEPTADGDDITIPTTDTSEKDKKIAFKIDENYTFVFFPVNRETKKPLPTKIKNPRIRRLHYNSGLDLTMSFFNLAVMLSTIPYFALVSLNIVFTNEFLTTSDYKCYDPTLYGELGDSWTDQFWTDWWINLSDFLYAITPIFQMYILLEANLNSGADEKDFNYWFLGITLFIKITTLFARGYQAIFCFYFNICRTCTGECTSSTNCPPNMAFKYAIFYNLFFVVVLFIYAIIQVGGLYHDSVVDYLDEQYDTLRLFAKGNVMILAEVDSVESFVTPRLLNVGKKFNRMSKRVSAFGDKMITNLGLVPRSSILPV